MLRTMRPDYRARALWLWPGLDTVKLARTHGEPMRIVRLVERRSALPPDAILAMLTGRSELPRPGEEGEEGEDPVATSRPRSATSSRVRLVRT